MSARAQKAEEARVAFACLRELTLIDRHALMKFSADDGCGRQQPSPRARASMARTIAPEAMRRIRMRRLNFWLIF